MSGGYFEYDQFRLTEHIEQLEEVINRGTLWEDGDDIPEDVLEEFKRGLKHFKLATLYMHRIDWLLSGDDGIDAFKRSLRDDLHKEGLDGTA